MSEEFYNLNRYREDLRRAHSIQLATLPEPPGHPDFAVAIEREPEAGVTGDFCAWFADRGLLGILLGDVCGRGFPAAMLATGVYHALDYLVLQRRDVIQYLGAARPQE